MAFNIETAKETGLVQIGVVPKSLLLCDIVAVDGDSVYLTTTPALGGATLTYNSKTYQARLLSNVIEQIQAQSPQGYDIPGAISLSIADGDVVIWTNHANAHGWRGGTLTVTFLLWDIPSNTYSTNSYVWVFILDKPGIDANGVITVAAQARQSMTRVNVPNVPRQNRCTHNFPSATDDALRYLQRGDGLYNPTSVYYACGYSPDWSGGVGNTTTANLTNPNGSKLTDSAGIYAMCDYTRQGCILRLGGGVNFAGTAWGTGAGDGGGLNAFSIQTGGDLAAIALFVGFPVLGLISWLFGGTYHGAPAGSTAMNLGHLLASKTVLAGDQFVVNGNRYTVTHNFTTDSLGNTPVTFKPPLVADVADGTLVYTTTAADGDITQDTAKRPTARFDGDTWLAQVKWEGKQYTNPGAGKQTGFNTPNPPTGSTYYAQGYGTQWVQGTVLEPVRDPNSYRSEVVVCVAVNGPASILKVVVAGVEVHENSGDFLFCYYMRSPGGHDANGNPMGGGRQGAVNGDSSFYQSQGDPHGGLCYIEVVVPVELVSSGIADVRVLVQFPQCLHAVPIATLAPSGGDTVVTFPSGVTPDDLPVGIVVYMKGASAGGSDGAYSVTASSSGTVTLGATPLTGTGGALYYYPLNGADTAMIDAKGAAAANPVWALMDLLCWGPFTVADFDAASWYAAAQICAEQISYLDINGAAATHARYRCSMALTTDKRQSMAKAVLALRNCAGIVLGRDPASGLLQCFIEQTLADQQPAPVAGSNYNTAVASLTAADTVANGYLAYLFDGAGSIEKGTLKITGRSLNDTPNTVAFPFQDSANVWVEDSLTTIDEKGYTSSGRQEIEAAIAIAGIENFDQGTRRANVELAKALYGNSRFDSGGTELISFRTTAKAAHLASRVGAICGIAYDQLGL